jgi:hypothetical protein
MNKEEIIVLNTASCPSLSGRSVLTYEIGCNGNKEIFIRITENSGAGMFSKAQISMIQIDALLSADDKPITAKTIRALYSGSVNSVGFLQAVLKDIGLIKNVEENSRNYTRADPKKFTAEIHAEIHALMDTESTPQKKPAKENKSKKLVEQETE